MFLIYSSIVSVHGSCGWRRLAVKGCSESDESLQKEEWRAAKVTDDGLRGDEPRNATGWSMEGNVPTGTSVVTRVIMYP